MVAGNRPYTHLGRGEPVSPAAQRGALCPVDHPYRGPLLPTKSKLIGMFRMFLDHTYPMDRTVKTIDQAVGIVRDVLFGELHDRIVALR